MKRTLILLLCIVLTSCAAMQTGAGWSADNTQQTRRQQARDGRLQTATSSENYPKVVVTPSGQHAQMMRPAGNHATVVNPDGTHSTAVINGSTATIVTP